MRIFRNDLFQAEVDVLPPEAQKNKKPIRGCYVHAWSEEDPDLEWILFTRSSITSLEEGLEIVAIYTQTN